MEKKELRIVYMGTPDFAVEPLRCLVEGGYNVVGVITMPDKPIGRHQTELSQSPVKEYAVAQGLPVLQPARLKDEAFVEELRALQADLQIVVAFRMLPEVVWQMPRLGTFNLHASLLPRYRGAAPINWAIINGDTETGITTFFLQHDIDTGNVIQQERIPITPTDNAESIHDQLMVLGGRLVVETVDNILANRVQPIPQEDMQLPVADYQRQAPKIFKDTCCIDWTRNAKATFDFIRGLSPYPGAWAEFPINDKPQVLKVFKSHIVEGISQHPVGTLFAQEGHLFVQQPDALQELDLVQLSGKKRMPAADFLRGVRLCLTALLCFLLTMPTLAQRRTISQMRSALTTVMTPQRAQRLQPVTRLVEGVTRENAHLTLEERTHTFRNLTVLNDSEAGFAVVSHSDDAPAVLAHGDSAIDPDNVAPAFIYLMSMYEAGADKSKAPRKVRYEEVPSMLSTQWGQNAPYNDKCPYYENTGKRSPTGCVATSMAQVLNYYKLPKKMRGYKTYTYTNGDGHSATLNFDYSATTIDWSHMRARYTNSFGTVQGTSDEKNAVATLMLACGVAASMQYNASTSAAFPYNAADGITSMMDGVEAYETYFDEQLMVDELKAGHPIIYGGRNSKNEGHSFVVDGVSASGKFRCNLGWNSSGNGEYAATDMNGYAYIQENLLIIQPTNDTHACTPLPTLQNLYASVRRQPVSTIRPNHWYVLWNTASARSPYSAGAGKAMKTRACMPSGESTSECADQLVRLVVGSDGKYYLQTGLGDYIGTLTAYGREALRSTASASAPFVLGSVLAGYYTLNNNNCHMRILDTVGMVEGGSPSQPTSTQHEAVWQFYDVALSDQLITDPNLVADIPDFENGKTYVLRNTGYSQGYLVALSSTDEHPTLRGVTTDHANGLFPGAQYHNPVDLNSDGAYWTIETEGVHQYLRNALTKKYLTNTGDKTCYVFTSTRTPIHIKQNANNTYSFNTGNQAESFLCAATNLENPAAFWEASDAGSVWTVEQVNMPSAHVAVTEITLSHTSLRLLNGEQQKVVASVLPANATNPRLQWSSSNTSVATVDATGTITAVGGGQTTITATSEDVPSVSASLVVSVVGRTQIPTTSMQFSNTLPYLLQNTPTSAYIVAEDGHTDHPTIRAAELTSHPDGYYYDNYTAPVDYTSPYSYWQILKDTQGAYYLRNVGNGLYLAHSAPGTPYIFKEEPTAIKINSKGGGNFSFNTSTDYRSYLCVSTNTENPLAYWIENNEYTSWKIYAVEGLDFTLTDPFAGTTVGVARVESAVSQNQSYDLQGRRVSAMAPMPGVVITNRNKYIKR